MVRRIHIKSTDTLRKKKGCRTTLTPPLVSCGKSERKLLKYLFNNESSRFNIKAYSRINKVPRSTLYDQLNKLKNQGFISREFANNKITTKGKIFLNAILGVSKRGVGSSRRECRKGLNLSTHYHKFKFPITSRVKFSKNRLSKLNPNDITENHLHNLSQLIVRFDDATIVINNNVMIINLYDVISSDVDSSDVDCLNRAISYAKSFISIGLVTSGMIVEEGHWARVESVLANFIYNKVDNKYFLDLGNNRKFWIDHSTNVVEDETNNKDVRLRIDSFLSDVANNKGFFSDISLITKSLGFINQIEVARLQREISLGKVQEVKQDKGSFDYVG